MMPLLAIAVAVAGHPQQFPSFEKVSVVRLEEPVRLYRDGRALSVQEGLVLQLRVNALTPFMARNIEPDFIFLGHGLCEIIELHLQKPELTAFCPLPQMGEKQQVWHAPPVMRPETLDAKRTQSLFETYASGVGITLPQGYPARGEVFKDLSALRHAVDAASRE